MTIDKVKVRAVCIDDFALKKCEKYGTVMIDMDTHRMIDMIESREAYDVTRWLKTYPNLQIFSRDGSLSYKKAIEDAHEVNVQVSDRFHIFQNLTTYAKEIFKKELKNKISIPSSQKEDISMVKIDKNLTLSQQNRTLSYHDKRKKALTLFNAGIKCSEICVKLNMDIRTLNKVLLMSEKELISSSMARTKEKQLEKRLAKQELINMCRDLFKEGKSKRKIARAMGLSRVTVDKYLDENCPLQHASIGQRRKSKLDPYKREIHKLFEKGWMSSQITREIRLKGYSGSDSNVRHYVGSLKKDPSDSVEAKEMTEMIERKNIIKALYHPVEELKVFTARQFESVCNLYPIVRKVYDLVWDFKMIFKNREVNRLSEWMKKAEQLEMKEFNSFVNGLKRDLEAVKNACIYDINNGLAEGFVNKIKVIKRVMYGRCSFNTLKQKILAIEKMKDFN